MGVDADAGARSWGLDVVRLAAMTCVAARHLLGLTGRDGGGFIPRYFSINLFTAISGYLALRSRGDGPLDWLSRRLNRLLPPYWLFLAALFAANGVAHYKPITPGLVVAQFLGVAWFTHPAALVGVTTWFISFILCCYALAAAVRWDRRLWGLFALAGLARFAVTHDSFALELLTFLAGVVVGLSAEPRRRAAEVSGACLLAALVYDRQAAYPLVGVLCLMAGLLPRGRRPRLLAAASRGTFEFYLTHGPVYLGLAKLAGFGLAANVLVGTPLAVLAAVVLRRASRLVRVVPRVWPRPAAPARVPLALSEPEANDGWLTQDGPRWPARGLAHPGCATPTTMP